jgi:hypothetical protein
MISDDGPQSSSSFSHSSRCSSPGSPGVPHGVHVHDPPRSSSSPPPPPLGGGVQAIGPPDPPPPSPPSSSSSPQLGDGGGSRGATPTDLSSSSRCGVGLLLPLPKTPPFVDDGGGMVVRTLGHRAATRTRRASSSTLRDGLPFDDVVVIVGVVVIFVSHPRL